MILLLTITEHVIRGTEGYFQLMIHILFATRSSPFIESKHSSCHDNTIHEYLYKISKTLFGRLFFQYNTEIPSDIQNE